MLMARWNRTTRWKHKMIALLAARDGMICWLCALPLSLVPKRPNKRISLEHLEPRSLGGSDTPDNLVLCHQHCNKHLDSRPRAQKEKMRQKWQAAIKRR